MAGLKSLCCVLPVFKKSLVLLFQELVYVSVQRQGSLCSKLKLLQGNSQDESILLLGSLGREEDPTLQHQVLFAV